MCALYAPFADFGAQLIDNGYPIIPIKPRSKQPAIDAWQLAQIGHNRHAKMASNGHAGDGLGIQTGKVGPSQLAVMLADVDSRNAALVATVSSWLRKLGLAVERVGEAPKIGLVFRAQPGIKKLKSKVFFDPGHVGEKEHAHALEWLGEGQQFVAFGIHPGTGKPYQQDGIFGSLLDVPVADLAEVTEDQMREGIAVFERAALALGLVPGLNGTSRAAASPANALGELAWLDKPMVPIDEVRGALLASDPDLVGYETWLKFGMALHHQFDGDPEGLELWDEWSQGSAEKPATSYHGHDDLASRWAGFRAAGNGTAPATIGTVLKAAREASKAAATEVEADFFGLRDAQPDPVQPVSIPENDDPWGRAMLASMRGGLHKMGLTEPEVNAMLSLPALGGSWRGCFVNPVQGKLYLLNKAGALAQFNPPDWRSALAGTFGHLVEREALDAAASGLAARTGAKTAAVRDELLKAVWSSFERHIKLYRQRTMLGVEVDPFCEGPAITLDADSAHVVYQHQAWKVDAVATELEAEVVADYLDHFDQFEEIIELLLHARFAADRREAFLWMRCASGWGKGFLLDGVLGALGLVTPVSVKDIERAFEGQPLGLDMNAFLRSWVLWVDEFKAAKSELKQLNRTITAAPKNQLRFSAPLYVKLFSSAESVDSIAGSEGVEAQFSERFSSVEIPEGLRLDDRPLFMKLGKTTYLAALTGYVARRLDAGIDQMRALGRRGAADLADAWLRDFHTRRSILNGRASLDDGLAEKAEEIVNLIQAYGRQRLGIITPEGSAHVDRLPPSLKQMLGVSIKLGTRAESPGRIAICRRPGALVKAWISATIDRSQQASVGHKTNKIVELMDAQSSAARWVVEDHRPVTIRAVLVDLELKVSGVAFFSATS